jgi:hypothetical protein
MRLESEDVDDRDARVLRPLANSRMHRNGTLLMARWTSSSLSGFFAFIRAGLHQRLRIAMSQDL